MKEKKSVKALKGQLFGAVAMMVVAAVALGTSTYAWFINNSVAVVEEMNLTVSTSTSMLVALEKQAVANTWTGYKSTITNADIKSTEEGGWTNFLTNQITPASVSSYSLMQTAPAFYATDNHVANSKLDQFDLLTAGTGDTNVGQGPVKKLGLKFLASNDVSVYLGQNALDNIANMITPKHAVSQADIDLMTAGEAKATAQAKFDAETAQATAVKAALRVAVVSQNNKYSASETLYTGGKVVTFQFDAGLTGMAGNNTDYKYTTQHFTSETEASTKVDITDGNLSAQISETAGKYAAIMTVDSPAKHVTATQILQATLPTAAGTGYLATVDTSNTVTAPTATPAVLFDLVANEPREVDVYIWLEGTDNECLNSLSGYNFNLVVPFAAVTKTAP